jgi:hypothetical protein
MNFIVKKKKREFQHHLSAQYFNTMTKYPPKYYINDNKMAASSSHDKEVYRTQQNVIKQQITVTP